MTEPTAATPGFSGGQPGANPPPPLSQRFVQVFTAPRRAMAAVAVRPAWLPPALLICGLMILYTAVNMHIILPEQTELQLEHATGAQVEMLEKQLDQFSDPPAWLRVLMGLGAGLSVLVFAVLLPGWLLHLFLRLSEGKGTVKQTIGVVCWAALIPYGLRTLLSWIIVVGTGSGRFAGLTLASVLPNPNPQSLTYTIAGVYGDPFTYWMLWVILLGVMIVHRLPFVRSLTVIAATYVLLSVFPIGGSLLGQVLAGR